MGCWQSFACTSHDTFKEMRSKESSEPGIACTLLDFCRVVKNFEITSSSDEFKVGHVRFVTGQDKSRREEVDAR